MEVKTGPKDVFLHLLSIISLYVAAGSFIALVFQYINVLIPDPLSGGYGYLSQAYSGIRWSLSILIVVFPVYVWSVWFLSKAYLASPEKRNLRSRRWLVYFTLFAAALIIIGDLITLIYNLLQGELTGRFLLKVLTVLAVAAIIFVYYLWEIRQSGSGEKPSYIKLLSYAVSLIAVVAVVAGFFIVGSPREERAFRFDEERVSHLATIQEQIVSFWQSKNRLPANLSELQDDIGGFVQPRDPESGQDYLYERTGNLSFRLCANFSRPSREKAATVPRPFEPYPADPFFSQENWQHGQGQTCFERTIDPERYAPLPKR